jgi:glycosyltransferase involved in cell wall biosynthesis
VEAVSILIQNKDLREQKKNAGLEHVKNFSWQKTALKTWEVISNC